MEAELPTEYDVVVAGTGLVECMVAAASARIGKKVLHLDKNDYYGSQWASFSLQGVSQWVEDLRAPQQQETTSGTGLLEEGERFVATCDPRKAYSKVKLAWHVEKTTGPSASTNMPSSPNDPPLESCADEKKPAAIVASDDGQSGDGKAPGVDVDEKNETDSKSKDSVPRDEVEEEKWSQDRMLSLSRKFNIDLAPKLLFSRGPMVELLISSNVARYAEFKCITRVLAWRPSDRNEELLVVPCSRSDVFTTSSVSLVEKRLLMKFLEFCHSYDDHPEQLEEYADKLFADFLKSRKLTDNLIHFVTESIAMVSDEVSCREGLEKMKLFLTSLGRYGMTPFLFSLYGCGELPQAFCRLCAVFEGTYVLRKAVSSLIIDSQNTCCGLLSEDQRFKCSHVVMEASYAPQEYISRPDSGKQQNISRGIFITDRSVLSNEKEQLTLLRLPAKDGNPQPVVIIEVGAGACVCPKNLYCVQMTCVGSDAEEDLKVAVQRLFSDKDSNRPTVLWNLYFNQIDLSGCDLTSNTPANVHLCSGPQAELDYDSAITQAKSVFLQMFPDEEFLPRAPDPEEIVFDNDGTVPKEGDNFDRGTSGETGECVEAAGNLEDIEESNVKEEMNETKGNADGSDKNAATVEA